MKQKITRIKGSRKPTVSAVWQVVSEQAPELLQLLELLNFSFKGLVFD